MPPIDYKLAASWRCAPTVLSNHSSRQLLSCTPPFLHFQDRLGGDPGFFQRSVAVAGDPAPLAHALRRARRGDGLRMAVFGGSVSTGGGCERDPTGRLCPTKFGVAGGYVGMLQLWLKLGLGVTNVTVVNAAVGGQGADYFSMCVDTLLADADAAPAELDLVILEVALNSFGCELRGVEQPTPPATGAAVIIERLLLLLRARAPRAAIIFLNGFGPRFDDAASCIELIGQFWNVPVLSWKRAVWPLLIEGSARQDELWAAEGFKRRAHEDENFPRPIHPNGEGHRQLAAIIVHFWLDAEARDAAGRHRGRAEPRTAQVASLTHPLYRLSGVTHGGTRLLGRSDTSGTPPPFRCTLHNQLQASGAYGSGWLQPDRRVKAYASSTLNATLHVPFTCAREGCGLLVGITASGTQPLGQADFYIDGQLRLYNVSASSPSYPKLTVLRYVQVAAAQGRKATSTLHMQAGSGCAPSSTHSECSLDAGPHTLSVTVRPMKDGVDRWRHLGHFYARGQFHVRHIVVGNEPFATIDTAQYDRYTR